MGIGILNIAGPAATDATLTFTDIATNNSSTTKHGFLLKLNNSATQFMNGQGAWVTPSGTNNYKLIYANQSTFSSVADAQIWTVSINAGDFVVGDEIDIVIQEDGASDALTAYVRINDGTNTFSSTALANSVNSGALWNYGITQGKTATTKLSCNGLCRQLVYTYSANEATMIANWIAAAFTLSGRGSLPSGSCGVSVWVYKKSAA